MSDKLGATGSFPEGKLTEHDEGELQMAVGAKDGNVILDFGTPVAWIGLPPEQAIDLGEMLIQKAASLGCLRPIKINVRWATSNS